MANVSTDDVLRSVGLCLVKLNDKILNYILGCPKTLAIQKKIGAAANVSTEDVLRLVGLCQVKTSATLRAFHLINATNHKD